MTQNIHQYNNEITWGTMCCLYGMHININLDIGLPVQFLVIPPVICIGSRSACSLHITTGILSQSKSDTLYVPVYITSYSSPFFVELETMIVCILSF